MFFIGVGLPFNRARAEGATEVWGQLDDHFATRYDQRGPGFAVVAERRGEIVWQAGYGLSDCQTGKKIDGKTLFYIASLSKAFTGLAIAQLAERGKLEVKTSIRHYEPLMPVYADTITVKHLLHHTGGLPHYEDLTEDDNLDMAEVVNLIGQTRKPLFVAGKKFDYSNSGYLVLARVIEAASGQDYPTYLQQHIFQPLGMKQSSSLPDRVVQVAGLAKTYDSEAKNTCAEVPFGDVGIDYLYGDGGVITSADDMIRWGRVILKQNALVRAQTWREIMTSGRLNDGSLTDYGYGWELSDGDLGKEITHSGSWAGWNSYMTVLPEQEFILVLLSNDQSFDGEEIEAKVMKTLQIIVRN